MIFQAPISRICFIDFYRISPGARQCFPLFSSSTKKTPCITDVLPLGCAVSWGLDAISEVVPRHVEPSRVGWNSWVLEVLCWLCTLWNVGSWLAIGSSRMPNMFKKVILNSTSFGLYIIIYTIWYVRVFLFAFHGSTCTWSSDFWSSDFFRPCSPSEKPSKRARGGTEWVALRGKCLTKLLVHDCCFSF